MTSSTGMTPRHVGVLLAATLIFAGYAAPAGAQQTGAGASAAKQNERAATRKPAATNTVRRLPDIERATAPDGGAWTLDDALLTPRSPPRVGASSPAPVTERASPGRLQVNQGTFGIETESKFKDNEFSDGRRVPGLETQKREQPSYFGLSLSVPTIDKSLIPMPLLPRSE